MVASIPESLFTFQMNGRSVKSCADWASSGRYSSPKICGTTSSICKSSCRDPIPKSASSCLRGEFSYTHLMPDFRDLRHAALEGHLRRHVDGEVRFDDA